MKIYNPSCLGLPIIIYFIIKKYHLHSGELWMLFYVGVLLLSVIIDGIIMQTTHLIFITALSIHILSISKQTSGHLSQKKYPFIVRVFLHLQQQLSIIVYALSAWLLLRLYTSKSFQYGIGLQYQSNKIFQGLNITLNGWNCTQFLFTLLPSFWLLINVLSYYIARQIIKVQIDRDNLYKEYVVKYIVLPYVLYSAIVFGFNLWSYINAKGLLQCTRYWDDAYLGTLVKLAEYFGFSYSVLIFFHVKKGVFEVQGEENTSDRADNEE